MQLPPDEQTLLRSLSPDLPALRQRVRALRARGWTLASIGAPLGANRSTVRSWEMHPRPSPPPSASSPSSPLPPPPDPPLNISRSPTTTHPHPPHPTPTPAEQTLIRTLAPRARRARAGTPPSSALYQARTQLNDLVLSLYDQGVPISHLADLAGVTYRAMSVRIHQAAQEATP